MISSDVVGSIAHACGGGCLKAYGRPTADYLEHTWTPDLSALREHDEIAFLDVGGREAGRRLLFASTPPADDPAAGDAAPSSPVALEVRRVPTSWPDWEGAPATAGASPTVLYARGRTSLTITLGDAQGAFRPACTIGFEIRPADREVHRYRGDFHDLHGDRLGRVYVSAGGRAGARVLGARHFGAGSIGSLTVTDISTTVRPGDFAIADLRLGAAGAVPPERSAAPGQRRRRATLRRNVSASSISPD